MVPLWIIDLCNAGERKDRLLSLTRSLNRVQETWLYTDLGRDISQEDKENLYAEVYGQVILDGQKFVRMMNEHPRILDEDPETKQFDESKSYHFGDEVLFDSRIWQYVGETNERLSPPSSSSAVWTQIGQVDRQNEKIKRLDGLLPLNECSVNICILGDVTELTTLKLFTVLPAAIKSGKTRIVADHIHQGISILGMLYMPSTIKEYPYENRQDALRCLQELEVQRNVSRTGGFDKVMLFQDTQHRTEKIYPTLTPLQQADFVFQSLIHLYYASDSFHPLLENNNNEDFYFAMGAGSLYYDARAQQEEDLRMIASRVLEVFSKEPEKDSASSSVPFLNEAVSFDSLVEAMQSEDAMPIIDTSLDNLVPKPAKHPVDQFADKGLKRYFYSSPKYAWIRHYPTRFLSAVINSVSHSTGDALLKVNENTRSYYEKVARRLVPDKIESIIKNNASPEKGGACLIRNKFEELKKEVINIRARVPAEIPDKIWIPFEESLEPEYHDAFQEYHDAFSNDGDSADGRCEDMKKEAMDKFVKHLKKGTTVFSRVIRAFLLGVIMVIGLMPVIELYLSGGFNSSQALRYPFHLDSLTGISQFWYLIAVLLFMIPAGWEMVQYYIYHRRLHRYQNRLVAYYLHDAYARFANRIHNQAIVFYDKVIRLCDEYLLRSEQVLQGQSLQDKVSTYEMELPRTTFNQPVVDGFCCVGSVGGEIKNERFFPHSEIGFGELEVNGKGVRIDKLGEKMIYEELINKHSQKIVLLYDGVCECVDDPEVDRDFVWSNAHKKFLGQFLPVVKKQLRKRNDTTVGDKLMTFKNDRLNLPGFKLFSEFCATSGEFTADDDIRHADLKTNSYSVPGLFNPYMPLYNCRFETDPSDRLLKSYLFLTIWRTFRSLSFTRVLPENDLEDKSYDLSDNYPENATEDKSSDDNVHCRYDSSLALYSLIGDLSAHWYRLFPPKTLSKVDAKCEKFRKLFMEDK